MFPLGNTSKKAVSGRAVQCATTIEVNFRICELASAFVQKILFCPRVYGAMCFAIPTG
jgi:hypothetical protein